MYRKILFVTLVSLNAMHCAFAESASVTAVLSNSQAAVGQMVQMEIKVAGASSIDAPNDIVVDGLEIHRTGTSRQFEMRNFATTSSTTFNYTILPLKPGTFRIPPQTVRTGSDSLRTPELTLRVAAAAGGQNPSARNPAGSSDSTSGIDPTKLAFAELIVPKKTAYVGEIIPVVVKVGFFGRGQLTELPEIKTQGFTMQKMQQPDQPQVESINGRRCETLTFKTAISPTRAGKFEIGPIEATAVVIVPRPRQRSTNRPRSPFDVFDMDDPFSDPFFADPFGMTGHQEKRTFRSEPVSLEVKPLPGNAPADFVGAVGNFNLAVAANPKSVQTGDPITVTATINGRGNFDRVTAPVLEESQGWHAYPPSSKFKQDDDVGISGTKTFDLVLSPNEKKQTIAPFTFSFFDPAKEKYVTLRSDAIPIKVEGGPVIASAATPAAAPAASQPGSSPPATKPAATPKAQGILYQLTERPDHSQSFVPLYGRRSFWLIQLVPFVALLGFVSWKIRRRKLGDRKAQRAAALHEEAADLMKKLRRADGSSGEYLSQASRAVQLKTALVKNVDPNTVDAETAAKAFRLDEGSQAQLRDLFARSDEARYSGGSNGGMSAENKRNVLSLIENLRP